MAAAVYPYEHSPIRDVVDPNGTLDAVFFTPNPAPAEYPEIDRYFIETEAGRVGCIDIDRDFSGEQSISGIMVSPQLRGRGYGMAAHVLAIETAHAAGNTIRTDPVWFSEGEAKIWQKIIAKGVGQVIEPIERYVEKLPNGDMRQEIDDEGRPLYTGHVRIPPLQRS